MDANGCTSYNGWLARHPLQTFAPHVQHLSRIQLAVVSCVAWPQASIFAAWYLVCGLNWRPQTLAQFCGTHGCNLVPTFLKLGLTTFQLNTQNRHTTHVVFSYSSLFDRKDMWQALLSHQLPLWWPCCWSHNLLQYSFRTNKFVVLGKNEHGVATGMVRWRHGFFFFTAKLSYASRSAQSRPKCSATCPNQIPKFENESLCN